MAVRPPTRAGLPEVPSFESINSSAAGAYSLACTKVRFFEVKRSFEQFVQASPASPRPLSARPSG